MEELVNKVNLFKNHLKGKNFKGIKKGRLNINLILALKNIYITIIFKISFRFVTIYPIMFQPEIIRELSFSYFSVLY